VPKQALVNALNVAYQDYYLPLNLTSGGFTDTLAREAIHLDASVVALDGAKIVGTGFLGARAPRGWIGGVGVVPAYRRRGIARALMEYLLDQARRLGLHSVQLEVITANGPAYALYRSLGFVRQRRLLILKHRPGQRPASRSQAGLPACQAHPAEELLRLLHTVDTVPRAWSREPASLLPFAHRFQGLVALHAEGDQPVGACLYAAHPFQVGIVALAGDSGAGTALLHALHNAHPEATRTYLNVPAEDPLLPELFQAGYRETLSQFEMHCKTGVN
jgi:GNAT superfamily N-acetyltransferase